MEEKVPSRKELEEQIVARAWADADFKQLLLTDPKAAIFKETGIQLPDGAEVTVLEESAGHGYIVIPVNTVELSDEQLEAVAAGDTWYNGITD
jgi:hypothetical protein